MHKATLRRDALQKRRAMPDFEATDKSERIANRVIVLPEFCSAGRILAYYAHRNEVDPTVALLSAEEAGKPVYLPRIEANQLDWRLVRLEGMALLDVGTHGTRESALIAPQLGTCLRTDLCLVPGVLFRSDGHRLGQGGGYFDRFLATFPGTSIGLAYDWQMDDNLPVEEHDVPVNLIVTETRVLAPGRERK